MPRGLICKLMEKMVNRRLVWWLEAHNFFSSVQCGFRKRRCTTDHLVRLDTAVRLAFKRKRHLLAVFFDIEKAYDTTWRAGILSKLFNFGIRGHMGHFISNFLTDRHFSVRIGDTLPNQYTQEEGVPQGSVLSVTLFGVMINDIVLCLPSGVSGSLYVDDFAIWCDVPTVAMGERRLQLCINKIADWGSANGFTFSKSKTVAIHFHNKRSVFSPPTLTLYQEMIPVSSTARFLGILFDHRLTYKPHVTELRTRCFTALNILKVTSRMRFGADRNTLLGLYRSLIRSKLDYGCHVYECTNSSTKNILNTVHHCAIRIATGAFRTSPITSLLVEANEPSLSMRREKLCMSYALRIRHMPSHPTYGCLFDRNVLHAFSRRPGERSSTSPLPVLIQDWSLASGVSSSKVLSLSHGDLPPWEIASTVFDLSLTRFQKCDTSSVVFQAHLQKILSEKSDYIHFYTDGSKSDIGTGCAF